MPMPLRPPPQGLLLRQTNFVEDDVCQVVEVRGQGEPRLQGLRVLRCQKRGACKGCDAKVLITSLDDHAARSVPVDIPQGRRADAEAQALAGGAAAQADAQPLCAHEEDALHGDAIRIQQHAPQVSNEVRGVHLGVEGRHVRIQFRLRSVSRREILAAQGAYANGLQDQVACAPQGLIQFLQGLRPWVLRVRRVLTCDSLLASLPARPPTGRMVPFPVPPGRLAAPAAGAALAAGPAALRYRARARPESSQANHRLALLIADMLVGAP
mmetsp:Transcript_99922/g.213961  ORF Transcript_99922/g.213961 Transcript_99922/m.213961 type:complete len:268 (-) Transcript_99922:401-1204(-)